MRLINVETRKFEEFIGRHIPEYAILSHTWGEEEVSFADYNNEDEEYKKKLGYIKIDYACRQAEENNILYCWVDTCNIDKTSSAELQEAINSMFRWYEEAVVCYVYLSDVLKNTFRRDFRSSRWFTRGWTLQELIAPRVVRFYDRNWEYCGTRSDFEDEISEITGIEPIYLQHRHFKDAPIAIKMSWAAKRTTTRLEDEAYCMLGLFNIFMPLIYGEGKMAFFRLQQEIVKVNPDQSIYAWGLPEDLSVSLLRKPPHCGTFQGIGWRNDFKYGELDSRLFAESARDFRHSGSLIPICHVTSDAAKTTGAQTITIELSIVAPEGENFHIGLLPFSSGAYPGHSIGMILELRNNRYCRVSWRRARNSGFTFAVPTSYVIQSHKKEITLLSQSFREPNHRETNLPQRGQNLFFMPGLQRNRASVMRPLDFRIIELSYKSSEQRKTSCFNFRSSPHHDEYAIIQLNMHESTPSFCTIAVKVTPQTLGIRQADSHDTCSSFRNKQFYDAILLTIENEKFIAKVISMSTLDTFVVQMHRIELNQDGRAASQNNSFLWYTWSIKTMVTEGRLGTRLEVNERSTELQ